MNWSRSIVALQWVRASAPAGCSPRGLGGVDDSFEGFNIFMLRDAPVFEPPRRVWSSFVEASLLRASPQASRA
jgi:hypothetical protein